MENPFSTYFFPFDLLIGLEWRGGLRTKCWKHLLCTSHYNTRLGGKRAVELQYRCSQIAKQMRLCRANDVCVPRDVPISYHDTSQHRLLYRRRRSANAPLRAHEDTDMKFFCCRVCWTLVFGSPYRSGSCLPRMRAGSL